MNQLLPSDVLIPQMEVTEKVTRLEPPKRSRTEEPGIIDMLICLYFVLDVSQEFREFRSLRDGMVNSSTGGMFLVL